MASYLVEVNYKVNGVAKKVSIGVADGVFPDVLSRAIETVTNHRAGKGETLTEISAVVIEAR